MVGPQSTQTRVIGIIMDKMHPYILFSSNRISMKMCRDASRLLLSLLLLFVYPTIPTHFFNLFSCFLYLFVSIFLSSIATETEGSGLVHVHSPLHEAMHRFFMYCQVCLLEKLEQLPRTIKAIGLASNKGRKLVVRAA